METEFKVGDIVTPKDPYGCGDIKPGVGIRVDHLGDGGWLGFDGHWFSTEPGKYNHHNVERFKLWELVLQIY